MLVKTSVYAMVGYISNISPLQALVRAFLGPNLMTVARMDFFKEDPLVMTLKKQTRIVLWDALQAMLEP